MSRTITLNGVEIRCVEVCPAGHYFDLAEALEKKAGFQLVAPLARFVRAIVIDEDKPLLEKALYDETNPITFLEVDAVVSDLVIGYAGRPTERPSDSRSGSSTTGAPSRADSHSQDSIQTPPRRIRRLGESSSSQASEAGVSLAS